MFPRPPVDDTVAPFMNQIAVLPLVSRHKRSALPSPLKSPVPTIDQAAGTTPSPPDDATAAPSRSHTARLRLASRQRMSPFPSPLKSAVATTDHVVDILPRPA